MPSRRINSANVDTPAPEEKVYQATRLVGGFNGDGESDIHPVLFEFANVLKRNIEYSTPHSEGRTVYKGPNLRIYFWSYPTTTTGGRALYRMSSNRMPSRVYGVELISGQSDRYIPESWLGADASRLELPENQFILYDDLGTITALVVDDTMYVLFDLPHAKGMGTRSIMRGIMEGFMDASDPERREMRKKVAAAKADALAAQVAADLLNAGIKQRIESLKLDFSSAQRNVDEYGLAVQNNARAMASAREQIQALESRIKPDMAEEIERLRALPRVQRVTTESGRLIVYTDDIFITTATAKYRIGPFKLRFGGERVMDMVNVELESKGTPYTLDHPHVRNHMPCLGNYGGLMEAATTDFVLATVLAFHFLESYSSGDAFNSIDQWPLAERLVEPTQEGTVVIDVTPVPEGGSDEQGDDEEWEDEPE